MQKNFKTSINKHQHNQYRQYNMYFLKSVHLKGYKNIRNTSATFCEGLNIVIGQNGSGKTNFFEFLDDVLRSTERQN